MSNNRFDFISENNVNDFNSNNVNNRKKSSGKGKNVFIIILILIMCGAGGYVYYQKGIIDNKIAELEEQINKEKAANTNNNSNNSNTESKTEAVKKQVIALSNSNYDKEHYYKVELATNGELILSTYAAKDKVIATSVNKAVYLQYGQTDICGHDIILIIKEDKTISAIDFAKVYCGETSIADVEYFSNLESYTNIVDAYNKYEFVNEYEPLKGLVIIEDENGKETDITKVFNK